MKTFTIIVYSDPLYSFAKVKRQVLVNLGLADRVSTHSYQYKDNVYLRVDSDLPLLCSTLMALDTRIKFVEKHTNNRSRIRSYSSYSTESTLS